MKNVMILTGAGQIGMAIARRMGAGMKIVIGDKSPQHAASIAETMNRAGFDAVPVEMDLSSRDSILALIDTARSCGEVSMLVNAAGVSPSQASVETILRVDLYGTAVLLEEVGRVICRGGVGVTVSSQSGHRLPALGEETDRLLDAAPYDYAVDAIDTLSPKLALIKGCLDRGIPLVSSMGAGAKTDPTRMEIADIGRTHHCPLAHMLRKRLHKLGIRTGFRAVFSAEPAREGSMILCEEQNKKSNVGTISYLPALFGIGCASVVVRDLLGEMEDSGKRESND